MNGRCTPLLFNAVVGHEPLDRQVDLADQHAVCIGIDDLAHLADHLVHLGPVGGVDRVEPGIGLLGALVKRAYLRSGGRPWPTGTMKNSIVNSIGSKRSSRTPLRAFCDC